MRRWTSNKGATSVPTAAARAVVKPPEMRTARVRLLGRQKATSEAAQGKLQPVPSPAAFPKAKPGFGSALGNTSSLRRLPPRWWYLRFAPLRHPAPLPGPPALHIRISSSSLPVYTNSSFLPWNFRLRTGRKGATDRGWHRHHAWRTPVWKATNQRVSIWPYYREQRPSEPMKRQREIRSRGAERAAPAEIQTQACWRGVTMTACGLTRLRRGGRGSARGRERDTAPFEQCHTRKTKTGIWMLTKISNKEIWLNKISSHIILYYILLLLSRKLYVHKNTNTQFCRTVWF